MRDPNRLDYYYDEMKMFHKYNFPDLRIGQLLINFSSWYVDTYGNDFFYVEDEEFVKIFKKYIKRVIS